MLGAIKDILFPNQCFCGELIPEESSLCHSCWEKMEFVSSNTCPKCGFPHEHNFGEDTLCPSCIQNEPEFDRAKFLFKYNDFSGKFITLFKYADKTYLSEIFTKLLVNKIREDTEFDRFDIVTSVPISKRRLLKRKFNQSAILANKISKELAIPVDNLLISRVKNVPPQTGLRRKDRLKNVKGVFKVAGKCKNKLEDARVIIIDDVFTTGATINECSKTLRAGGAKEIFVLTLARTFLN